MKTLKNPFSNWPGLLALLVAALIFWGSPLLMRAIDPTAGTFDVGYLQRPLVAAAYFFFATFCAWMAIQIDFPTLHRWISDHFASAWDEIDPTVRVIIIMGLFLALMVLFLGCLFLMPV